MNLHEYQAKKLLKANGIKVPKSQISNSVDDTFEISKLKAFPSPASNNITLSYDLKKQDIISIHLVDILGKKTIIMKDQIQNAGINSVDINTDKYSNGNYYFKIISKDSHKIINFIIEK